VHHARRALGENGLEKLKKVDLSFDDLSNGHCRVSWAKTVTLENLLFFEIADLDLDVVSGATVGYLLLLIVYNVKNLTRETAGSNGEAVTKTNSSLLDLSKNNGTSSFLHFVEYGNSERCFGVSSCDWHIIENFKECWARIPTANTVRDGLSQILTSQS